MTMNVLRVDYTAADAGEKFAKSLRETGFGVLTHHPIAQADIQKLYDEWQDFFLQEAASKQSFDVNPKTQDGWVSPTLAEVAKGATIRDLKEFYNYYPWGRCPQALAQLTQALFDQLAGVAATVLQWLHDATPTDIRSHYSMPLPDMIADSRSSLFRINYYPPLTGEEEAGAVRAAAHGDIDLLTVLTAGSAPGLQAQDSQGQWIDVPCDHGNLVINSGDMLRECSNGYYPSTQHRVLNPTGEAATQPRMSCPLFLHPRPEVKLSERYTADSYLHERLVELGLRKEEDKVN
tara:strand:+ start:6053 stop:6925 length:873 start_codon:yes stop_codon:yes gene_type:complete